MPKPQNTQRLKLTALLQKIEKKTSKESTILSQDIFRHTELLRQSFKRRTSPWSHNFLVNIGLKDKGLCYHWSDALYLHLTSQHYQNFEFHLVGANIGKYWTEHNALVVIAKGDKIMQGIVIDPWRNMYTLYFAPIEEDKAYQWHHRSRRGCLR